MGSEVKIGILGVGEIGRIHLNNFLSMKNVKVVAACDKDLSLEYKIVKNGVKFYENAAEMFKKEDMDGVVIATPHTLHKEHVAMAASRNIHILCEKPIADSISDAKEIINICNNNKDIIFMLAMKYRYAKTFSLIKSRLSYLGRPLWAMYDFCFGKIELQRWKVGEGGTNGIIVEGIVHAIDIMRFLSGEVERVYAEGDNFVYENIKVPDSAIMVLRFKNGMIGAIGGGTTSDDRISKEYFDMHFENGVVQVSGNTDYPYDLRLLMRDEENIEDHHFPGSDGIKEEAKYFIDCIIDGNKKPLADACDGLKDLEISLAAIKSIREKIPVILK